MSLSVNKQMPKYENMSFTVGRIPKGFRNSKMVVPAQKVTGLESLCLVLQLMSVAAKSRLKKKYEMNLTREKQRQWWLLWSRGYKSNK